MTGGITVSEAPTTGLGKLLMENRFFVPTHQRDYRWDEDRVKKLFEDLTEAMERQDQFYFIGLMVFMRADDGRLRVLDGQQRLATTMMILSAIRAWFGGNEGGHATATQIQADFIGRSELGETRVLPKLSLNFNNDDRFQRYVIAGSPIAEVRAERAATNRNAPNYPLLDAIVYCHDRISGIATSHANAKLTAEYLIRLAKFIRDSVIVVRLTVPNEANAFRVFETLNDRGLDLSAVDLLKNYLFGLAHEEAGPLLAQVEGRWAQITQALQNAKEEDFLRVFWTSRHGRTQLDQIFEDVRSKYKSGTAANDLSIDLLEAAEHYAALDVSDDPVWARFSLEVKERISTLRMLGSKQVRPVLLSAIKCFDVTEFERLLRLLEVVTVRWQLIGGERTGAIEIQCARLAHLIFQKRVETAQKARETLDAVYLSDSAFHAKFAEKDNLSNQKAVYLLRQIEEHERQVQMGATAKELGPSRALTTEHVLPRNPSDEWSDEIRADASLVADCALRLGNICLLSEPRNRDAGRNSFDDKKAIYAASDLFTTREIASHKKWDRQAIHHHQSWLAKRATAIWRYP
jgi:hypothetical protein